MTFHCWRWGFWCRMGSQGRGVTAGWMPPLFSERQGLRKRWRLGGFVVMLLAVCSTQGPTVCEDEAW
jgi:hypothetical protein